jgi:hypothetical protein
MRPPRALCDRTPLPPSACALGAIRVFIGVSVLCWSSALLVVFCGLWVWRRWDVDARRLQCALGLWATALGLGGAALLVDGENFINNRCVVGATGGEPLFHRVCLFANEADVEHGAGTVAGSGGLSRAMEAEFRTAWNGLFSGCDQPPKEELHRINSSWFDATCRLICRIHA